MPKENEYWWSWFINLFRVSFKDYISIESMVTISDRAKGLLNAMEEIFPEVPHAMCCQHLAENVHKKFGQEARSLF